METQVRDIKALVDVSNIDRFKFVLSTVGETFFVCIDMYMYVLRK